MHHVPSRPKAHKTAGILIPLFSVRTARSLGIGDIADLPELGRWALDHGQRLVQLLPLGDLPEGETSPYSAATSFAIDPMYVAVDRLEDLTDEERHALIGPDAEATLTRIRSAPNVDYGTVRAIKRRMLRAAFDRFFVEEWEPHGPRAHAFQQFLEEHAGWVTDYALYRALKARHAENWWRGWPVGIRDREPGALERARRELGREALLHAWVQWVAHEQWAEARKVVNGMGVELMGDLPFMVGVDSADVWGDRKDFFVDATLGVPGDALAPDGQDWGLPAYDWGAMDKDDLAWVRRRSAHMGRLFDRFRVDHLVGYYRMYVRPRTGGAPFWMPDQEPLQIARGEKVLDAIVSAARGVGAHVIAEDLGTIPPFVRASLARLQVPGYKVMMWERDGDVFRDPASYPHLSLATSGTHDTVTMATWWETMPFDERRHALRDIPQLRAVAEGRDVDQLTPRVHDALLDALYAAGSELTLLPIQDLWGSKDRINVPGVVGAMNWSWRMPMTIDELRKHDPTARRMVAARDAARRNGR
ncbi:MAG: 4-alpha-glucanotransferase [Deltaproteobacteria bacterium]|nr:4-alpha-glucanotransferase [Deltaproteobacteria bacterium]